MLNVGYLAVSLAMNCVTSRIGLVSAMLLILKAILEFAQ